MRNIADEIFSDVFFGSLSLAQRLLWIGLITSVADDQGRMEDNAAVIKARIFPYDDNVTIKEVEQGLILFSKKHKIDRYAVGSNGTGKRLIQIVNWWKYQRKTQWANRSLLPSPPLWVDRIRTHDKGSINIVTVNWGHAGGYVATTKQFRSISNVADTHPQRRSNEADKEKIEDSIKKILLSLLSGEQKKVLEAHPEWVTEAIHIASENGKHSNKYIAGILKNWILEGRSQKGKPARANGNHTKPSAKPEAPNPTSYTDKDRAAAARALARRKANV